MKPNPIQKEVLSFSFSLPTQII